VPSRAREALHAYIRLPASPEDRKGWLFRTSRANDATKLTEQPMTSLTAGA